MRKIILLMHVSLDGFVAGPNGEMDWIKIDDEMFDDVGRLTDEADTAIYGRVTYGMMESYWPTAADHPNATKHDIEHSHWYNKSLKIIFSRTMEKATGNIKIIHDGIASEMQKLKEQPGKNMLMIGSPSTVHSFMQLGLIDEYYLMLNPVLLGKGIPLFSNIKEQTDLSLLKTKTFNSGVVELHYETKRT